jgi:hypothetical protein
VVSFWVRRVHDAAIGADGAFTLPVVTEQTETITVVTPPIDGRPRAVDCRAAAARCRSPTSANCELLSLRIVDGNGGPAVAADVLAPYRTTATRSTSSTRRRWCPIPAGRVDVLLQRGRWTLLAADATHWGALELTAWGANAPATLALEPKPSARVRVVDAAGKPVAAARVSMPRGSARAIGRSRGLDAALAALGWNMFANQVAWRDDRRARRGDAVLAAVPWRTAAGARLRRRLLAPQRRRPDHRRGRARGAEAAAMIAAPPAEDDGPGSTTAVSGFRPDPARRARAARATLGSSPEVASVMNPN